MDEGQLRELLDSIRDLGCASLELTGGEVFDWPHIDAVLPLLASLPLSVSIFTNGTLLTAERAAVLLGSEIDLSMSLDGPPEVHDELRGEGSYAGVERAAQLCVDRGIPFRLASTVTRRSLPHLAQTLRLAVELGATGVDFGPLERLDGRSITLAEQKLDDEALIDMMAKLTLLRDKTPEGFEVSWHNIGMRVFAELHPCSVFACWGEFCLSQKFWPAHLYLMPDGEVLPQAMHIHPRYSAGNAFEQGLGPIVEQYWGSEQHRRFQTLCRHVYQDLIHRSGRPLFYWDELAREASVRPFDEIPVHTTVTHLHDHSEELEQARKDGLLEGLEFPLQLR